MSRIKDKKERQIENGEWNMTIAIQDAAVRPQTSKVTVIAASTIGTIFEWYDFYLYGSLAAVLGKSLFHDHELEIH
jgi:imidazole glycerol phosphate synthase subunit HisF